MRSPNPAWIERAATLIAQADALVVAAGAGMGVDSGLPDFRGGEGFWKAYPALGKARIDFQRIASPEAFAAHPALAWGFYGHRLDLYRRTVPHAGFSLLRRWGDKLPRGCAVFTSNVDGQFQRAGFDEQLIHECHGSIHHLQCLAPCSEAIWPADGFVPVIDEAACLLLDKAPTCPRCGAMARPNVMMFGDYGWIEARERAQAARLQAWLGSASRPVVIEIGAGTAIPSVRLFSRHVARAFGGRVIRINTREAAGVDAVDVALAMGALEACSAIAAALGEAWA